MERLVTGLLPHVTAVILLLSCVVRAGDDVFSCATHLRMLYEMENTVQETLKQELMDPQIDQNRTNIIKG